MSSSHFVKIDSHAHLTSDELYPNLEDIIKRAQNEGVVALININTDLLTLERGLMVQKKYPGYFFNAGATTPHDVEKEGEKYFDTFAKHARSKDLVAIGETGLDYFYEHSDRELQKHFLIKYLDLAREVNLPVIIHCRGDEAFIDLFEIANGYKDIPFLLHCFTGNPEQAKIAADRGYYMSISGIATFKKSEVLRQTIKNIPLELILIETDAPYLAPQSKRGLVNEPAFIGETLHTVALCKDISEEEAALAIRKNTCDFFRLSSSILKKT